MPITFDTPEELLTFLYYVQARELSETQQDDRPAPANTKLSRANLKEKIVKTQTKQRIPVAAFQSVTKQEIEELKTGGKLAAAVDAIIQRFLDLNQPFTEDDIYFELAKTDKNLNALPVLITIYRRMWGPFIHVSRSGQSPDTVYNS